MYYVSARDTIANVIASAISDDGLHFVREEGLRIEGMVDPAIVMLPSGQYWLFGMVGLGQPGSPLVIRSATSADGLRFIWDDGVLVRSGGPDDRTGLFDPSVIPIGDGRYRMYYGGDAQKTLSAVGTRVGNPRIGAAALDRKLLSPASIASLYGDSMTTDAERTRVEVNGRRGEVLHASPTQINFVVPEGIAWRQAHVIVTSPDGRQTTALAPLQQVAPSLFASPSGEVAALDAVRFTPGPFAAGASDTYIALFATGLRNARKVEVTLGGIPIEVVYAGPQGGFAGLDQVNVRIPAGFALRGAQPVSLVADEVSAPSGFTLALTDAGTR
jgi:uncharacterized protein (TIGR03437 family)